MGTPGTVRVDGLRRIRADLRRAGEDTQDLKDANAAVAALVAREAAPRAPKRTGRLAGSGRGNRAVGRATVTWGGAAVPYAGPIHWGWTARGIEPQPFITDAAEATQARWLAMYLADVSEAFDRLDGRTY